MAAATYDELKDLTDISKRLLDTSRRLLLEAKKQNAPWAESVAFEIAQQAERAAEVAHALASRRG